MSSLFCTPEIDIILEVSYTSVKKNGMNNYTHNDMSEIQGHFFKI